MQLVAAGYAWFTRAQFTGEAFFGTAQFAKGAGFKGARATLGERYVVWPPGWTTRPAQPDNREDPAFLHLAKVEDSNPPDA